MEIDNIHKNAFIPEALRDGTVIIEDSFLVSKDDVSIIDLKITDSIILNDDDRILRFLIYDKMKRFSSKVMFEMINYFTDKNFKLFYWDGFWDMYHFYFVIPKTMHELNSIQIIDELSLKHQ